MAAKIQEAEEHCRDAERCLKTTLLRWKPDYNAAADAYDNAAQCYRIARDLKKSKECYLKASEYYQKTRSLFYAAKCLDNAILVSKDNASPEEIYKLACESSSLYQEHGSGDSGASVLDKAGKIVEERSPEYACKLYQRAADASASTSSRHQGAEYIGKANRLLVRLKKFDDAADGIRQEIDYYLESGNHGVAGRLAVAAVLVQLARKDVVAADKCFKEWSSNCELSEVQTLSTLLQAYDDGDPDNAKRALASPFIRNMDIDYARLATLIDLPKGEPTATKDKDNGEAEEGDPESEEGLFC